MALERVCKMTLNERESYFEDFINLRGYYWKKICCSYLAKKKRKKEKPRKNIHTKKSFQFLYLAFNYLGPPDRQFYMAVLGFVLLQLPKLSV